MQNIIFLKLKINGISGKDGKTIDTEH